jgi:cytochrome c biogenesis protein ResB
MVFSTKLYTTKLLKKLADLRLAIWLLASIGILIALGTFIEQDQPLAFYQENYPTTAPILGFVDWKFIHH